MKIRNGFVSNSSSSSFVVIADEVDDVTVTIKANFRELVDITLKTEEEVRSYYLNEHYWDPDKRELTDEQKWVEFMTSDDIDYTFHHDNINNILEALKSGKQVAICSAGNDGGGISQYIYENEDLDQLNVKGGKLLEL